MILFWRKKNKRKTKCCYHNDVCRWKRYSFNNEVKITRWFVWTKILKKRILKKRNLTEKNHQINMNFDHSVSSNNSFKSHLNTKNFNMFFYSIAIVQSTVILIQCLLQGWCECIRVMCIQLQEKTEKHPRDKKYHQKHHLMAMVMKIFLMQIKLVGNNRK